MYWTSSHYDPFTTHFFGSNLPRWYSAIEHKVTINTVIPLPRPPKCFKLLWIRLQDVQLSLIGFRHLHAYNGFGFAMVRTKIFVIKTNSILINFSKTWRLRGEIRTMGYIKKTTKNRMTHQCERTSRKIIYVHLPPLPLHNLMNYSLRGKKYSSDMDKTVEKNAEK